ncbi:MULTISPECIES: glycosyltransferase [unclassified Streptomyces]|uniref:glycosyltransferase n=1 Tax=unclassified Streptomyces TaxID=2593676 RepID=UPI000DC7B2EF|nr:MULTISPECIES: glycosyltransferase [unclassified Streptomyces]AWZ07986.1 hypothetical protein DRB89_29080 [Streptomyces sp. ICC4]AWZ15729.1 hypothetical protein DRB96_29650 [Streptomyces sp. ICC1]
MSSELPNPQVTAVVLTYNEEKRLGACLRALSADVDEVLLIDSGSTDGTLAIAASQPLPVRVVHAPWRSDFAHQRNLAFSHIHRGWILMVDADEVLAPTSGTTTVRQVLAQLDHRQSHPDLVGCPEIQDVHDRAGHSTDLPRILRAQTTLRYRGRIHERPYDAAGNQPATVALPIRLTHYGYLPEVIAEQSKEERHTSLLRLCRVEEPDNPKWVFYQVRAELAALSDSTQAQELFSCLATAMAHCPDDAPDYLTERVEDSWSLMCELALHFGGAEQIASYSARLEDTGRHAEAVYYRTVVAMSATLTRLSHLTEQVLGPLARGTRGTARDIGRLHELQGLLALACGRTDMVPRALEQAVAHGAGSVLISELARLQKLLSATPSDHQTVHHSQEKSS